jgi:hypothetical protein
MSASARLLGMSLGPFLNVKIALTGTNLDIVTTSTVHTTPNLFGPTMRYSTQDRSVDLKMRFDEDETIFDSTQATDTHHVEFSYYQPDYADSKSRLLIGFSANGQSVTLQLNLREEMLKTVVSACHRLKDQEAQHQLEEDKKGEAEAAEKKAQDNAALLKQPIDSFITAFGHGPIPEEAKTLPEPGICSFAGPYPHVILKLTQPTELMLEKPYYSFTKHKPVGNRVLGTLPAGQMFDYDPCALPSDHYADVVLLKEDPWVRLNRYAAGDVPNEALAYGSARDWEEFKKRSEVDWSVAWEQDFQHRLAAFASAVTAALGPIPTGASECAQISKCRAHFISFKTLKDTDVLSHLVPGAPAGHTPLPFGTQVCTDDAAEVQGGYVRLACGSNATVIMPGGKKDLLLGWIAIDALSYDTDHPKHE